VAFQNGITSFSRLQRRGRERVPVFLYLFDLPRHEGEDLRARPLRERKARLRSALEFEGPLRFTPHRKGEHGEEVYLEACEKGLEGVIAKRADSPYRGGRSRDWLKLKCHAEQELVIGGYTAPKGSRTEFGALLVGYYDDRGRLRYAGKVGTGFDQHTLRELGARLRELEQDESPFERFKPIPPGTHWVQPELVGQVGFAEWTRDGRLRHPRYLGLRDDKPAREVVRELPS
jgi:DNA ligase D-like protein (predicted ligase)